MTEETEKMCPHCGKKLRRDNSRGACSDCLAKGKPAPAGDDILDEPRRKSSKNSDTIKRFRIVASALGKDPDAILEEAAQAWLDVVAKAVE